ncbi:MAG: class I SAM-dependent methyltransferase [Chloroflexota bacterium]|nr:class I SAM-dependent methyltransferase [Chloroflexota bacterium]
MDLRDLSFSDGSFYVAICSHVLEHALHRDPIFRCTKPRPRGVAA